MTVGVLRLELAIHDAQSLKELVAKVQAEYGDRYL